MAASGREVTPPFVIGPYCMKTDLKCPRKVELSRPFFLLLRFRLSNKGLFNIPFCEKR